MRPRAGLVCKLSSWHGRQAFVLENDLDAADNADRRRAHCRVSISRGFRAFDPEPPLDSALEDDRTLDRDG